MMRQKVTVVGIGYVGLGVGVTLSTNHDVTMLDVDQEKVDLINGRKSATSLSRTDTILNLMT